MVHRLHKALQNPRLEEEMDLEDEVLNEFHKKDELLAAALQHAEAERSAKNALIHRLHGRVSA
ncbi:MAG: hypothetical protein OHK0039_48190 [Bacteroidia bacterium]